MKYKCIGCRNEFSQKGNYENHMNRKNPCIDNKKMIFNILIELHKKNKEIKEIESCMSIIEKENKKLKKQNLEQNEKINELAENQKQLIVNGSNTNNSCRKMRDINNTHNITNNTTLTTNNVTLVNIGHENLGHITSILKNDLHQVITDNPVESLVNCMKEIYWSDKTPENRIIGYDKDNDCLLIHEDGRWLSKKGSFIIKNIKPFFMRIESLYDSGTLDDSGDNKFKELRPTINMNPYIPIPFTPYKRKNIKRFSKKIINTAALPKS